MKDPNTLTHEEIEVIERLCLRWMHRAVCDFGYEAWDIFYQSPDDVKDVAEDITREMLDRLGGYQIQQRVLGNVDYRKARYIILPDSTVRQALFVDSKAEKESRSATMQMSQISMVVRQKRGGGHTDVVGKVPRIAIYAGQPYLTTTLLLHYYYQEEDGKRLLQHVTLAAVPNGLLQDIYNPTSEDTIWLAGRNAPTRGEEFRVRLSFAGLSGRRPWRVQRVRYNQSRKSIAGAWTEERWSP